MQRISSRNNLNSMRVHFEPLVVWLGTVVIIVALFSHRTIRYEMAGVAQGPVYQIASVCAGRLESVSVELFDKVTKGQVLAVVNGVLPDEPTRSELGAQLAALQAGIAQIAAESKAARAEYVAQVDSGKTEWVADARAFATDASDTKLRILELTTDIETDQALVEELSVAIKRFMVGGSLSDGNDVAVYDLLLLKAQQATIAKKIEYNKRAREQLQLEVTAMIARESEFKGKHEPYLGTSDEEAEEVRIRQVEALERDKDVVLAQLEALENRASLELKSPIDGIIIPIPGNSNEVDLRRPGENFMRRAGEMVSPGEPIFAVVETEPREIVAYVNESQLGRVREGTAVRLIKNTEPVQMAMSQVTYVSPVLERMPERLWVSPTVPQWGRAVLIGIPPGLELVSGELVGIRGL